MLEITRITWWTNWEDGFSRLQPKHIHQRQLNLIWCWLRNHRRWKKLLAGGKWRIRIGDQIFKESLDTRRSLTGRSSVRLTTMLRFVSEKCNYRILLVRWVLNQNCAMRWIFQINRLRKQKLWTGVKPDITQDFTPRTEKSKSSTSNFIY